MQTDRRIRYVQGRSPVLLRAMHMHILYDCTACKIHHFLSIFVRILKLSVVLVQLTTHTACVCPRENVVITLVLFNMDQCVASAVDGPQSHLFPYIVMWWARNPDVFVYTISTPHPSNRLLQIQRSSARSTSCGFCWSRTPPTALLMLCCC